MIQIHGTSRSRFTIPLPTMKFLRKPTAEDLAAKQLAEHKRRLLEAKANATWASKMVEYHEECIAELEQSASKA